MMVFVGGLELELGAGMKNGGGRRGEGKWHVRRRMRAPDVMRNIYKEERRREGEGEERKRWMTSMNKSHNKSR